MYIVSPDISLKLHELEQTVNACISFFQKPLDFTQMVYTKWSAKDVLGHLVFWHESFARNVHDLDLGIKPSPLKGKLSEVNQLSVDSTKPATIQMLTDRFLAAQKTISKSIFNANIELIPYKQGSRPYSRAEHLTVVDQHIKKHLKDLKAFFN